MPRSVLSPQELSDRIKAARLLRGLSQDELADRLRDAGLTWRLAGELERGEQTMLALHRVALSVALEFPQRWFIVPLDELCPEPPPEIPSDEAQRILERLDQIIERLGETP